MLRKLFPVLIVTVVLLGLTVSLVWAATWTVNSAADPGSGGCNATECTLREAIAAANNGDTITFAGDYTILLGSELYINKTLTIDGAGRTVTVSGNNVGRVFRIGSTGVVTISNLSIAGGASTSSGGGVYNAGALTLNRCVVRNNAATGTYGGGVYGATGSTTTMNQCQVYGNTTSRGGGVFVNGGALTMNQNHVYNNTATTRGGGVAVYDGALALNQDQVYGNTADRGGGVYAYTGTLTIESVVIHNNAASTSGGGIYLNGSGAAVVRNSTIRDNSGASSGGGGIYLGANKVMTLETSTLSGNHANWGGGLWYAPAVSVTGVVSNCTISGNRVINRNGVSGVYVTNGTLNFNHVTVAANTGITQSYAIRAATGVIKLRHSIIGHNTSVSSQCYGAIISQNYNLASDNSCNLTGAGDQPNTDAGLGPLALYGGRTKTHALFSGSPAISAVQSADCPDTDQRGKVRSDINVCDSGAFERQSSDVDGVAINIPQQEEMPIGSNTGVSVTVSSDHPITISVYKRAEAPGLSHTSGEFPILWTMTAEGEGASYAIDLKLCYTNFELMASGVIDESTIRAYRWNETTSAWEQKPGTLVTATNCMTVPGVTELSVWTLAGDNQAPTALTLRAVNAKNTLWSVGTIALAASLLLIRRRKTA